MITIQQRRLLMAAKKKIGMNEEEYRAALASVGVTSSKDLTNESFGQLIKSFEPLGFNPQPVVDREGYATTKQKNYIKYLWGTSPAVRDRSSGALAHYCKRITGIDSLNWLPQEKVEHVIKAIKSLKPSV